MDWKTYEKEVYDFLPDTAKKIIQETPEKAVFCRDGIIDEDVFGKASLNGKPFRPLFILKEVHDKDGCNGCGELLSGCKNHGKNEAFGMHWIDFSKCKNGYKAQEGTTAKLLEFEEIIEEVLKVDLGNIDRRNILSRVAIINLKKIGGGGTAESYKSHRTLSYSCHAQKFENRIKKQIEEIKPSIIVCGGTYGEVGKILGANKKIDARYESCKVFSSLLLNEDVEIFDMYHPKQTRLKDEVIKEQFRMVCEDAKKRLK